MITEINGYRTKKVLENYKANFFSPYMGNDVIEINSIISKRLALELNKSFFEVIISKGFRKNALKILKKKKNVRLIDCSQYNSTGKKHYLFLENSFLIQDSNDILLNKKLKIVTKKRPSLSQIQSLKFAFNIC